MSQTKGLSSTIAELVDAMENRPLATVSPKAGLPEIISVFAKATHTRLIYVEESNKQLVGAISLGNLIKHLFFHLNDTEIDNLHLMSMATSEKAADFIDRPIISAYLTETIEPVLQRMLSATIKEIPVLNDLGHLVAVLTLIDILNLCSEDILANERG